MGIFGVAVQVRALPHSSANFSLSSPCCFPLSLLLSFPRRKVFELMTALHTKLERLPHSKFPSESLPIALPLAEDWEPLLPPPPAPYPSTSHRYFSGAVML